MATDIFYADTGNSAGLVSTDASYANARAGTGSGLSTSGVSQPYIGQWNDYTCEVYLAGFDTSSLSDSDSVSSAVLAIWPTQDLSTTDFSLQARVYDFGSGAVSTGDFVAGADLGSHTLAGSLSTSGLSTGAYVDLSDTAMSANVSLTGYTRVIFASDRMASGTTPTTGEEVRIYSAGGTQPPRLTVTHEASATASPRGMLTSRQSVNRASSW